MGVINISNCVFHERDLFGFKRDWEKTHKCCLTTLVGLLSINVVSSDYLASRIMGFLQQNNFPYLHCMNKSFSANYLTLYRIALQE